MCRLFLFGEPHGDARMGLARIFGLCAAILFASSVNSAVTIDLGPSDYRNFGTSGAHTGAGIRSSFGQTVRMPPLSTNLSVTRNAVVPYASAAARMRPFTAVHPVSAAASAAVAGLFVAMDWYFDEELGEWAVQEAENIPPIEGSGWQGYESVGGEACWMRGYSTPMAACEAMTTCFPDGASINSLTRVSDTRFDCRINIVGGNSNYNTRITAPGGLQCPSGSIYNGEVGACQQYVSTPVIEGEYSRLAGELPNMPADRVAEGTGDAQRRYGAAPGYQDTQMTGPSSVSGPETTSTSTDPVTGDTTVTTTSTTTNINYGDTTITTSDTTTTTTYQNGQETSTTVTTETPGELPVSSGGGGVSGDWPGFCDWATVVCDWLNWTQEDPPPEEDLPALIDDDFYEEKNISFGSKSCPPDYELNLAPFLPQAVAVSFQPICDFASLIYYMVMAASYIIAAYISIGVARNA